MSESGAPHTRWYAVMAAPLLLLGAVLLAMHLLNPLTAGPAGILFLFCLIYLWCLSLTFALLYVGSHVLSRSSWSGARALKARKAYYVASVLACFPVLLLAISSIGQVDVVSVGLTALFVGLATFYIVRRT